MFIILCSLQILTSLKLCLKTLFLGRNLYSGVLSFLKCINYLSKIYIILTKDNTLENLNNYDATFTFLPSNLNVFIIVGVIRLEKTLFSG